MFRPPPQHGFAMAGQGAANLNLRGVAGAEVEAAEHHYAVAIQHSHGRKRHRRRVVRDRPQLAPYGDCRRIGRHARGRGATGREDVHRAQVDLRRLWHDHPFAGRAPAAGPCPFVGGGQRRALCDQLGLGLLDDGVFIDAQEHRADAGQGGDEQQGAEQDGAQRQRRPMSFCPILRRADQAQAPMR